MGDSTERGGGLSTSSASRTFTCQRRGFPSGEGCRRSVSRIHSAASGITPLGIPPFREEIGSRRSTATAALRAAGRTLRCQNRETRCFQLIVRIAKVLYRNRRGEPLGRIQDLY